MNIFRRKLHASFGQLALYETALISLGIAIGTVFHEFFGTLLVPLGLLFVLPGTYVLVKWSKQLFGPDTTNSHHTTE